MTWSEGSDRLYCWSKVWRSDAMEGSSYATTIAIVSPAPLPATVPFEKVMSFTP